MDILGLTPGRRGCININSGKVGSKSREHDEECRKRHENEMRKTGDARMVQQDYRLLKSMEQKYNKLTHKKAKEDNSELSSTNPQQDCCH